MSHSRETEHYQLPLYDGTDIINPLTDFNNANEMIDETMYNVAQRAASAEQSAQQSAGVVHDYDERVTEAENTAQNAGIKADNTMNMIAEEFNPLKEGGYAIGDIVIYNQHLYSFINPHIGAWDASDVVEKPIGEALESTIAQAKDDIAQEVTDAISQIDAQLARVTNTQSMIAAPFNPDKVGGYKAGSIVTYADKLYEFDNDHVGAWTGTDVTQTNVYDVAKAMSSHVGMIIQSTTLDTETKLKAIYGSNTSWIQHSGYVLRGATSGVVANNNIKTGGNDDAVVVKHAHDITFSSEILNYQSGSNNVDIHSVQMPEAASYSVETFEEGVNATNANIPNYKSIYIWERIA